jgi:hypothetical protein
LAGDVHLDFVADLRHKFAQAEIGALEHRRRLRKSDDTLRIAARLVRADDGYVIWSEIYDRPLANKLLVQDDIAGEVTKALRASID